MTQRLGHLVDQVTTVPGGDPISFVALENIGSRTGRLLSDAELPLRSPDPTGMTGFRAGDVLFGKLRSYLAKSWRADRDGVCSTELIVMRARPSVRGRWLGYLAQSDLFVEWAEATSEGVKMPRTSWEKLRRLEVRAPSLSEQDAIGDYLDAETAHIDEIVLSRRLMIDLLLERRSAFISHWVDRGMSTRVRRVISMCTSGPRGWGDLVTDTGSKFIRSANLTRASIRLVNDGMAYVPLQATPEANRSRVHEGDVLVAITGANTGWVGIADATHEGAFVSQHVAILRPLHIEPEWLAYSIASDRGQRALLGSQYGGTKAQLGLEDLRELEVRVPDREEQTAALGAVRDIEVATQQAVSVTLRQIDLLLERRHALITAAVTGQLEIPGVAA